MSNWQRPRTLLHTQSYEPLRRLEEFHNAFNVPRFWEQDQDGRAKTLALRIKLIKEEVAEALHELEEGLLDQTYHASLNGRFGNLEALAKELADVLVVVYGTAEVLAIPLEDVFNEVMRSNMSKLGEDGKPIYREDGKVLKGPNYKEADVHGVFTGEWK